MFTATIYCQNHAKYTCTLCGKDAMILNAKTKQYSPTPTQRHFLFVDLWQYIESSDKSKFCKRGNFCSQT